MRQPIHWLVPFWIFESWHASLLLHTCHRHIAEHIRLAHFSTSLRFKPDTLMRRAGIDRLVLPHQISHVSENMTRRYLHVATSDKRATVQALYEERV